MQIPYLVALRTTSHQPGTQHSSAQPILERPHSIWRQSNYNKPTWAVCRTAATLFIHHVCFGHCHSLKVILPSSFSSISTCSAQLADPSKVKICQVRPFPPEKTHFAHYAHCSQGFIQMKTCSSSHQDFSLPFYTSSELLKTQETVPFYCRSIILPSGTNDRNIILLCSFYCVSISSISFLNSESSTIRFFISSWITILSPSSVTDLILSSNIVLLPCVSENSIICLASASHYFQLSIHYHSSEH